MTVGADVDLNKRKAMFGMLQMRRVKRLQRRR